MSRKEILEKYLLYKSIVTGSPQDPKSVSFEEARLAILYSAVRVVSRHLEPECVIINKPRFIGKTETCLNFRRKDREDV